MKAKWFSGLLATLLVVAMLLTMVGCGNKPEPDPSQDNDVSTGVSQDDNSQVEDDATDSTDESADVTDESADATDESADATDESTDATDESADVSDESTDDTTTTTKKGETTTTTKKGQTTKTTKKGETTKTTVKTTTKKGETTKTTTKTTTKNSESNKTTTKTPAGPSKATTTTTKATTTKMTSNTTPAAGSEEDLWSKIPDSVNGKKVKVLIWWNKYPDGGDVIKANTFQEKTGATVTYETAELKKYQTRLSAMVMAQNSPNIAAIINEWYPQPITRKLMQPISNTGWDFSDDDVYAKKMMDQFSYKGEYYGISLVGSAMSTFYVMFYNKNILTQKGVTKDPTQLWKEGNWNWETCLDIAQKTTDNAKGKTGLTVTYINYWMLSAGQDFVLADKSGLKNNVKSKELLEAWYFAWDLIYTHKVVDTSFTDKTPFYSGNSAMFGGGSYMMQAKGENYVPKNMPEGSWGVVPFPSPKGMDPVAACEGMVWGFPTGKKNSGDALQAAAWYLRYYLDDKNYRDETLYNKSECWEVMDWMWEQDIQSFNSVGVLTYGGEHSAASIQYNLIDEASSGKDTLKSNLDSWYSVLETNINKIENELT